MNSINQDSSPSNDSSVSSPGVPAQQQLEQVSARKGAFFMQNASEGLFGRNWLHRFYDKTLQNEVAMRLIDIASPGLFLSMRGDSVQLVCKCKEFARKPYWPTESVMREVGLSWLRSLASDGERRYARQGAFHVPGLPLNENLSATGYVIQGDVVHGQEPADSVAALLFYDFDGVASLLFDEVLHHLGFERRTWRSHIEELFRKDIASSLLPMLASAFRYRDSRFGAFSPAAAMRYWEDAEMSSRSQSDPSRLPATVRVPPWDTDSKLHETVTISVDLRRSTYCMEFAKSEEKFARWIHHLVVKMREVTHLHSGVFDKFTGDGCIVHFLQSDFGDCGDNGGLNAVDHALACAVDLQRAIEIHMRGLRKFLKHDSPVFGAGIAIDIGIAHWSSMRGDPAPIVVGKGVVGACRVGNKAPRLSIRLTNLAYNELCAEYRERLSGITRVNMETKEVPGSFPLECWEFKLDKEINLGKGPDQIASLCDKVRRRLPEV